MSSDLLLNLPINDACALNSPLLDDVPTLDDLLLPGDEELGENFLAKPQTSDFPTDLDPTLLFPEPVELVEDISEPVTSQISPGDTLSDPQTSPDHVNVNSDLIYSTKPAPRRKRRKDELDYFRVKAKELEEQLQQLLKNEDATEGAHEKVWRKVARRQLEGKKRAERENEKLRGMVEGQLSIVQNLEKLLRKRSALEESGAWENERKRVRVEFETENVVFGRILEQLDEQYKETDAAFRQNAFAGKKMDGQHVQVKPDGVYGMFMEFLSSKILPFELHTTATQFWRCMAQPHLKLRDGHYSLIDGTEDTLSAKMAFTVQHNQHQVLKDAWFAVKRYVEEDRCVFVWACETKVKGTLSSAQSMRHRDTGWTLVERYSSGDDSLESCIIQTCVRVRTELPEVMPRSQEELMLLTDIVSSSFLENLDGIHQSVEDALLEETMRIT